jgi:hypothetical protein
MPAAKELVEIKIRLPEELLRRISGGASIENRPLEDEVRLLIERGLRQRDNLEAGIAAARAAYDEELARTGKVRPTTKELWEQMERIREEVARDNYPE